MACRSLGCPLASTDPAEFLLMVDLLNLPDFFLQRATLFEFFSLCPAATYQPLPPVISSGAAASPPPVDAAGLALMLAVVWFSVMCFLGLPLFLHVLHFIHIFVPDPDPPLPVRRIGEAAHPGPVLDLRNSPERPAHPRAVLRPAVPPRAVLRPRQVHPPAVVLRPRTSVLKPRCFRKRRTRILDKATALTTASSLSSTTLTNASKLLDRCGAFDHAVLSLSIHLHHRALVHLPRVLPGAALPSTTSSVRTSPSSRP